MDIEFDLNNSTFKPYRKPNNNPLYVNKKSNHPPSVLKQIPKGIGKRLSELSSSEEIFKAAAPQYEEALKKSGFDEKLVYSPVESEQIQEERHVHRSHKIIYYNPPIFFNCENEPWWRVPETHLNSLPCKE